MSPEFFFAKGNDKHGPFSAAEMKRLAAAGHLSRDDLVWKTGAADWVRASRVGGLFLPEAAEPPPLPDASGPVEQGDPNDEVKTAAVALFGALTRRATDATQKALGSASHYTSAVQDDLRKLRQRIPEDRLAEVADTTKTLTRQLAALGVESLALTPAQTAMIRRVSLVVGAGAALVLAVFLSKRSESPTVANGDSAAVTFTFAPAARGKSAAAAKRELLETARKVEGPFLVVVEDIVKRVETGDQPISVADSRMYEFRPGMHQFSQETLAAYQRWRAAKIAED